MSQTIVTHASPAKDAGRLAKAATPAARTIELPEPCVRATQNPVEHESAYPPPEVQLERFLAKLLVKEPMADATDGIMSERPATRYRR